jgi:phosphohistidine swiveling domain-containing protein
MAVGNTLTRGTCTADRVGGKAAALARLGAEVSVPPWGAVEVECFDAMLQHDDIRAARVQARQHLDAGDTAAAAVTMQDAISAFSVPKEVADRVAALLEQLDAPIVAVRSSAIDEDGSTHSYAGQFDTLLGVRSAAAVIDAVRTCWASAFTERVMQYRTHHGLDPLATRMAVIIQEQVNAASSGIMFTGDPVRGDSTTMVISACRGLGDVLVSGQIDGDTYRIDRRSASIETTRSDQEFRVALDSAGGTIKLPLSPAECASPVLSDDVVLELVAIGERLESAAGGSAQDIEWAHDGERLVILQCRPVTSPMQPRGLHRVWDNSNIVESYSGVVTPLTFSFAREAYAGVYLQAMGLLRIPRVEEPRARIITRQMLGYLNGRVYYNLGSWYYLLSVLPNYEAHKAAMEQMMGVRETIDHAVVPTPSRGRTASMALGMAWYLLTATPRIRKFRSRLAATLSEFRRPWDTANADEIVGAYEDLKVRLLGNWQVPIINDFRVMLFFDRLRRTVQAMEIDDQGTLANDLMCGQGEIESAEPTYMLLRMAAHIRSSPTLRRTVLEHSDPTLRDAIDALVAGGNPAAAHVAAELDHYLERFGDRCANELKLETPTLRENPAFLYSVLRNYVRDPQMTEAELHRREDQIRDTALARVYEHLDSRRWSSLRRVVFGWLLRQARNAVRDREALRMDRTRVFGVVRNLMTALGMRLAEQGLISQPADVFFLEVDEVIGTVQGTCTTRNLKALVDVRRSEHHQWCADDAMPDRIVTTGITNASPFNDAYAEVDISVDTLLGTGCCPGIVSQPVQVVHAPDVGVSINGDIMACTRTDPGWVPLFPSCAGLLVERGSLLSHSAIVAREFGIPAIVGIPGLMSWVRSGDVVTMDGSTGRVQRNTQSPEPGG